MVHVFACASRLTDYPVLHAKTYTCSNEQGRKDPPCHRVCFPKAGENVKQVKKNEIIFAVERK